MKKLVRNESLMGVSTTKDTKKLITKIIKLIEKDAPYVKYFNLNRNHSKLIRLALCNLFYNFPEKNHIQEVIKYLEKPSEFDIFLEKLISEAKT